MTPSTHDLQSPVDAILELLGARLDAGQIVVHVADGGHVQKIELNRVYRPAKRAKGLDGPSE